MRYFLQLQVYSGFETLSKDVFLYKEINKSDAKKIDTDLFKRPIGADNTEKDKTIGYTMYKLGDYTFANLALHKHHGSYAGTKGFKILVWTYQKDGWKKSISWLNRARKAKRNLK